MSLSIHLQIHSPLLFIQRTSAAVLSIISCSKILQLVKGSSQNARKLARHPERITLSFSLRGLVVFVLQSFFFGSLKRSEANSVSQKVKRFRNEAIF